MDAALHTTGCNNAVDKRLPFFVCKSESHSGQRHQQNACDVNESLTNEQEFVFSEALLSQQHRRYSFPLHSAKMKPPVSVDLK